jgi:hypothetical protein
MAHQITRIAASTLGPFVAGTVFAAAAEEARTSVASGLASVAPGLTIIAFAVALMLTLMFRTTVGKLSRIITEKIGRRRITRILNAKSASVLSDFILPGAFGGLTRIDHAILTSGGIICIQTKHYNGIIFGDPDEPQWSNVDGAQRRKFLNPRIQNEGRSKALKNAVPGVPVAHLVVFTGRVQFTSSRDENVIHIGQLESYIAEHAFGPSKIKDWDAVWLTVLSTVLADEDSLKDFQSQVSFG